jgi:hypothetical protein
MALWRDDAVPGAWLPTRGSGTGRVQTVEIAPAPQSAGATNPAPRAEWVSMNGVHERRSAGESGGYRQWVSTIDAIDVEWVSTIQRSMVKGCPRSKSGHPRITCESRITNAVDHWNHQ